MNDLLGARCKVRGPGSQRIARRQQLGQRQNAEPGPNLLQGLAAVGAVTVLPSTVAALIAPYRMLSL